MAYQTLFVVQAQVTKLIEYVKDLDLTIQKCRDCKISKLGETYKGATPRKLCSEHPTIGVWVGEL